MTPPDIDFAAAPLATAAEALKANMAKVPEKDREFAQSLLSSHATGRVSHKQAHWLRVLAAKAAAPAPGPAVSALGPIVTMIDKAATHLKRPALLINGGELGTIRLARMSDTSRTPGAIGVSSTGSFADRKWYGRIMRDGTYQASPGIMPATASAIGAALSAMAKAPAATAKAYGKLTGACCFCGIALTEPRSVKVGYGPTCAEHWGLPWGGK